MTSSHLVLRGLTYYWRTNTAVVLGVATAVTVLAGALLVGDSVRGSLRDLVLQRLGRTDDLVASSTFFREALAEDLRGDPSFAGRFRDICPIVAVQGLVTDQASGQRALGVQVYGIDDRFWQFHGVAPKPLTATGARREVLLSPALARDIGAQPGGTILVRVQRPSDIPLDSLHGRKDDLGRTVRLTFGGVLSAGELGEFSLRAQQGEVRAAFVPLARLQQELSLPHRVNAMLLSRASVAEAAAAAAGLTPGSTTAPAASDIETLVRRHTTLEDLGLDVRALDTRGALSVETSGTLISVPLARAAFSAAAAQGMRAAPVFTYLVDSIRLDRSSSRSGADPQARSGSDTPVIPYSLVTAIDLETIAPGVAQDPGAPPPLVLNEWAARNLGAKTGDTVTLDYLAWEDPGILEPRSAAFRLARIVSIEGSAADRDLVPVFPGVTTSENLRDWDPPFPIDLRRIRPIDEDYWHTYRATPKAFIPFQAGQSLWQSRHGGQTSIRVTPARGVSLDSARQPYVEQLRGRLSPFELGFSVHDVRSEGLEASGGATDFGEYFTYFSFFLVASALLLAVLFFKLGVEQRGREVGLLRAVGFTTASVRRLFAFEALVVSLAGSVLGLLGAVAYGSLMMAGLRTWWVDAVGTTALRLHVTLLSLAVGGIGGVLAAVASIWWTLRSLKHVSERSLLAGRVAEDSTRGNSAEPAASRRRWSVTALAALSFLVLGLLLIGVNLAGKMDGTGAFFGAGTALLAACLCGLAVSLRLPSSHTLGGHGWRPLTRLGFRNAAHRPGRSVLSVAVMASATFVLIAVGAFRKDDTQAMTDPHSGTGGYALLVNTMLPIVYDPNSADGRELLGLGIDRT